MSVHASASNSTVETSTAPAFLSICSCSDSSPLRLAARTMLRPGASLTPDLEADLTSSAEEQYRLDVIHVRTRSHRSSVLDYRRGMTLTPPPPRHRHSRLSPKTG